MGWSGYLPRREKSNFLSRMTSFTSHFFIFKSGSERSGLTKKMIHITIKKRRVHENTRREALCRLATFRRPVV
jgi:hypothetical protein